MAFADAFNCGSKTGEPSAHDHNVDIRRFGWSCGGHDNRNVDNKGGAAANQIEQTERTEICTASFITEIGNRDNGLSLHEVVNADEFSADEGLPEEVSKQGKTTYLEGWRRSPAASARCAHQPAGSTVRGAVGMVEVSSSTAEIRFRRLD